MFALAGRPGWQAVWSPAWRGRAATSPACRFSRPILPASELELLREVVPSLRRLAIMGNVGNAASVLEMGEVQAAARTLGLEVDTLEIRRAEDIAPAFERAQAGRADALYVCSDPLANANRFASTPWRWARDCRRCYGFGNMSKPEV